MTSNSKLAKVLEHLVKGEEDLARDLLHSVFIEKARAIHEELMNKDEETHEEEMEEGVVVTVEAGDEDNAAVGGSGDQGKDLTNEIKALEDEIDFEETMSEDGEDEEVGDEVAPMDGEAGMGDEEGGMEMDGDEAPMGDDAGMDMGGEEGGEASVESVESKMSDLEAALAELKAEFEKLEGGSDDAAMGGDEAPADDSAMGDEVADDAAVDSADDSEVDATDDSEEDDAEDNWALDEEFDELAESLELEVVTKDMEKSQKTPQDVGSASSGQTVGKDAKSPVAKSQTTRLGAKPVDVTKGDPSHTGFNLQTAPKSGDINIANSNKDNRRNKSTDGTKKVSKEGDASAVLNKTTSEFGIGSAGKMSPLSKGGQNLK